MSNGIAANQTSQSPLHLRISDGNLPAVLGTFQFEAQIAVLQANATNYVFLDLSQNPPTLVVNQSGFPASDVWTIATAVTNDTKITQLMDSRPAFNNMAFGGGSAAGATGDVQFNNAGAFGNANSVAAGVVVNVDSSGDFIIDLSSLGGGYLVTASQFTADVVGNLLFQSANGDVTFQTSSGNVALQGTQVQVAAIGGDVTVGSDNGALSITEAGQVTLTNTSISIPGLQVFANNAAAIAGGLVANDLYRTGADPDPVCIVH